MTDLNEGELLKGPEGAEETKAEESDLALLRHTREQLKERLQAVQETQGPARWLFDKVPSPRVLRAVAHTYPPMELTRSSTGVPCRPGAALARGPDQAQATAQNRIQ